MERALDYLFILDNTPHTTMDITADGIKAALAKGASSPLALVLATESYQALSPPMKLSTVEVKCGGPSCSAKYGAYVLE